MNKSNPQKSKKDWFKKLDNPLQSINLQYAKLFYKKKEITKNQKILNEYNIRNEDNKIKIKRKNSLFDDDTILLKRINIYNYKELTRENIIMKKILSKIKERCHKKKTNTRLRLKRFKTNLEYEQLYSSPKNNENSSQNNNKLKLQNINMNYSSNNPSTTDRNKNEKKELKLILNKGLKLNLNIDDINSENKEIYFYEKKNINNINEEDNSNNFFQTLTRVDKYKNTNKNINNRNKSNKIYNLYRMMNMIKMEEDNGENINKDILYIKKNKKISNSINQNKNKNKKINLSINYSKICNSKKEIKIVNNPDIKIFDYLKKNHITRHSQKKFLTVNNEEENKNVFDKSAINKKQNLFLPILSNKPKNN